MKCHSFPYFNPLSYFQSFLGAIIDTLLYQLHDSLARLANVRKLERSREDGKYCRMRNKYGRTCGNYKFKIKFAENVLTVLRQK